jgi:hypothetical protein
LVSHEHELRSDRGFQDCECSQQSDDVLVRVAAAYGQQVRFTDLITIPYLLKRVGMKFFRRMLHTKRDDANPLLSDAKFFDELQLHEVRIDDDSIRPLSRTRQNESHEKSMRSGDAAGKVTMNQIMNG